MGFLFIFYSPEKSPPFGEAFFLLLTFCSPKLQNPLYKRLSSALPTSSILVGVTKQESTENSVLFLFPFYSRAFRMLNIFHKSEIFFDIFCSPFAHLHFFDVFCSLFAHQKSTGRTDASKDNI